MGSSHPALQSRSGAVSSLILPSVPLTGCDCQAPPQRRRHEDDHLCGSHRVMSPAVGARRGHVPVTAGKGQAKWSGEVFGF